MIDYRIIQLFFSYGGGSKTVAASDRRLDFQPFDGSSYADAVGPTVHFPLDKAQVDPWAPHVTETHNRFFAARNLAGKLTAFCRTLR